VVLCRSVMEKDEFFLNFEDNVGEKNASCGKRMDASRVGNWPESNPGIRKRSQSKVWVLENRPCRHEDCIILGVGSTQTRKVTAPTYLC
jgi:hypothetical protein